MLEQAPVTPEQMTADLDFQQSLAQLFTLIPYAQLILEQAQLDGTEQDVVDLIFETLVRDFSTTAVDLHGKASSTDAQQQWVLDEHPQARHRRAPRRSHLRRDLCARRVLRDARVGTGARVERSSAVVPPRTGRLVLLDSRAHQRPQELGGQLALIGELDEALTSVEAGGLDRGLLGGEERWREP